MGFDPTGHWDWQTQAVAGVVVVLIGVALLLAPPTGGASLGVISLTASAIITAGGSAVITGTIMVGDSLAQAAAYFAKQSKKSGKERASDKPSWVSQSDVDLGKSSQQNATELLNDKYGSGNWSKGPRTEFNQIVKWIDRGLKAVVVSTIANMLLEE